MSRISMLILSALLAMTGCKRVDPDALHQETVETEIEQPQEPAAPAYRPPVAPEYWLITKMGIAVSLPEALPGDTIALLYSSWCPKARESLTKLIPLLKGDLPTYNIVGVFANGELTQLLEDPGHLEAEGVSKETQAQLREHVKRAGIGTGLVKPEYAYPTEAAKIPRFRMPREQWERLGGTPGGFQFVCFRNGIKRSCPGDLG